jgi:glycosyltransferase involved in cell wall biosynthesis
MRILYVTAHYPPDFTSGATLQLQRVARHVAAASHEVAVLSGAIGLRDGETRTEIVDDVTLHWLGTADRLAQDDDGNWLNPAATAYAAEVMDRWRPDVLHAHALQTLGADLLAEAAARGIATVVTMHDLWWWCARLFLVDRALRPCPLDTIRSECECARTAGWRRERAARLAVALAGVDQILVPSVALRDVVVLNGIDATRVEVDANDVDPAAAVVSESPPERSGGAVRFVYVGGEQPLKGRDVMLAAARRLHRRRGWRLTTYGVRRQAGLRTRWHERRVRFEDAYPPAATAGVLSGADVLVIPSIARESFSLVAREALAAGLAVITSDCLGPTEVVADDVNGLVVPIGDAAALARAMQRLIDDRQLLTRLRTAARSEPPELRRPADHAGALVDRYRRLVADRELRHRLRTRPQQ